MIHIAICDDDPILSAQVQRKIGEYLVEERIPGDIKCFKNGELLLYDVHDKRPIDLLFLDIEMPGCNGMEIAKAVKEKIPYCVLIFLTSHSEYATKAFKVEAYRYIMKSEMQEELIEALEDAINMISKQNDKYYTITSCHWMEKVCYRDILYIIKNKKNAEIYTLDGKIIKVRKSLADVYEELNVKEFVYVDRGCIGNLFRMSQIKEAKVVFDNKIEMPVSRSCYQKMREVLAEFWGGMV